MNRAAVTFKAKKYLSCEVAAKHISQWIKSKRTKRLRKKVDKDIKS